VYLQTAAKIAWRDLRAAPAKFLFVILSVAVGVAALSGVKGFGYAFQGMLLRNAKQLLAADVQAQTWNDPSSEQAAHIESIGRSAGAITNVVETVSMARSGAQRTPQMVAVK
jgi:putative ABC transport system permease protein